MLHIKPSRRIALPVVLAILTQVVTPFSDIASGRPKSPRTGLTSSDVFTGRGTMKSTGDESTAQTDLIRQMPITANDVIYNPSTKMLYASVPSSVGAGGNSIATIDPVTGAIGTSVFIGSEPK